MKKNGHIYFIMGISWAGKGTLVRNIRALKRDDFHFPCSYTTREIRPWELDGEAYNFVHRDDFLTAITDDEFIEYALVHKKDYYGTKYKDVIEEGIKKGKIVVKELDLGGLKKLKTEKPELDSLYSAVFLNIPKNMLRQRIESRGLFMSDEEYERRLSSALLEEEELMKYCDYTIDATLSPEGVMEKFLELVRGS